MKIERINEDTLKFYVSYLDIEDRGFDREEIWFNKDRSEELFWQIMDEAHNQESFSLEGPLWIQVQALEKGMEILVTRAQVSKNGTNFQIPVSAERHLELPVKGESVSENDEEEPEADGSESESSDVRHEDIQDLTFIIEFKDIEDLIELSHVISLDGESDTSLYFYQNSYYLKVVFSDDLDEEQQDDLLSRILEFGEDTGVTESILNEYGKKIIENGALDSLQAYFRRID